MDLVAVLVAALVSASAVVISELVQRRFFIPYLATHPREPRQPPLVRMGLGLDDVTVGPWDFVPAWRVLNRPVPPELTKRQRAARLAFVFMIGVAAAGPICSAWLGSPAIGIGWFAGFFVGVSFKGWGSALGVSREMAVDGFDRTTRIVLGITMLMPFAALVAAMLLATSYRPHP